MKLPLRMLLRVLLSSLLTLVITGFALAQSGSQSVEVKIGTILASNQGNEFDAKLASLEKQLKVMKYRSYKLLKEESQNVQGNASATFTIPGGRSLVVTQQDSKNNQHALKIHLQQGDKPELDTVVRLKNGGNFILGGPKHESGVLVLSIWATAQ